MTSSNHMLRRVSERITAGAGAIALTAFILLVSNAHASMTERVGKSIPVSYSLDALASDAGAADVYRKLKAAARKVCDVNDGSRTLEREVAARKCYDGALDDAVSKVDRPRLSALHDAAVARRVG